jgi:hypothetical protein
MQRLATTAFVAGGLFAAMVVMLHLADRESDQAFPPGQSRGQRLAAKWLMPAVLAFAVGQGLYAMWAAGPTFRAFVNWLAWMVGGLLALFPTLAVVAAVGRRLPDRWRLDWLGPR